MSACCDGSVVHMPLIHRATSHGAAQAPHRPCAFSRALKKRKKRSRRAADTAAEACCRSHASGSGARGFDADSWGAGYGGDVGRADRYAGGSSAGCGVWRSHPLWVRGHRVRTEPARAGSVFWGGARCAAWPVGVKAPSQKSANGRQNTTHKPVSTCAGSGR
jgi:hypothetical protein